jgi:uncharacterized protein (TIGR02466 family)
LLQLNDGGIFLFPPLVWKYRYDFDLKSLEPKIEHLFSLVETNSKLEYGEAVSTVSVDRHLQPHGWEELADFQNWLGLKLEHLKDTYRFKYRHSEVTQSWCNKHLSQGLTSEHNHNYSTFVVSCYLKCPSGSGNIEFKDPLEYHMNTFPMEPDETLYREIPVETNDVLIFPGWMRHRVQPNNTDQERLVMTFNIK